MWTNQKPFIRRRAGEIIAVQFFNIFIKRSGAQAIKSPGETRFGIRSFA